MNDIPKTKWKYSFIKDLNLKMLFFFFNDLLTNLVKLE